jgi:hypothetical protein
MAETSSPVKRPRLSLQIKAISQDQTGRASRTLAATVDPRSPTSFNTLSNVYVSAISKSTPVQSEPLTAIHLRPRPRLQLQTKCDSVPDGRINTPFVGHFPDTPLTAQPLSPGMVVDRTMVPPPPSITMTATPPLSAGPMDPPPLPKLVTDALVFPSATASSMMTMTTAGERTPRRRTTFPMTGGPMADGRLLAPYSHPRALHSILRNSPLPPSSAKTPLTPRRQSLRLAERAARRVGYNSPLEQEITTQHYTRSHIDLLLQDDVSPYSPAEMPLDDAAMTPASALVYESFEIRDGGQTPGPFEEMRRRMAGLGTSTPISPALPATPATGGVRKRKRKEKKRQWVWTIGEDNEDESGGSAGGGLAPTKAAQIAATLVQAVPAPISRPAILLAGPANNPPRHQAQSTLIEPPPTPSIESSSGMDSIFEDPMDDDAAMSETTSITSEAGDMDLDLETPIATRRPMAAMGEKPRSRLSSVASDLFNPETGSRRDTPVPELIAQAERD